MGLDQLTTLQPSTSTRRRDRSPWRKKLDFESRGDPDDGKYVVVVEVFDPSPDTTSVPTRGYDFIVVVITAEDVNEDPVLSGRPELTIERD